MSLDLIGTHEPRFAALVDAFREGFAGRPKMGAALSLVVGGKTVVDIGAGYADARNGRRWTPDTPSVIFSCTKGLTSILAARLVQDGRLDYDAPVTRYWPEFAAKGKGATLVRHLLSHQAGLSAPDADWTLDDVLDWSAATSRLAGQAPLWPAGTGHAYHALTHGWLVGEVIRRVTGRSVGQFFAEMVARPLKAEAWIGFHNGPGSAPAHLRHSSSAIEAMTAPVDTWQERAITLGGAFSRGFLTETEGFNDPRVHAAEVPGAGAMATARGLAKIWSATIAETDGVRLLDPQILDIALAPQSEGPWVFSTPGPPYLRWGMGFELPSLAAPHLPDFGFGHGGYGGQTCFADRETKIGFAYLTNWLEGAGDNRNSLLIETLDDLRRSGIAG